MKIFTAELKDEYKIEVFFNNNLNLEEAIDIVKKIKIKKAYFTHISHNLGKHNKINKLLPKNISF